MRGSARGISQIVVVGSILLLGSPAVAADPIAIADEIVAAVAGGTRIATYEIATEANDVVTITGFAIADEPNGAFGEIAEIIVVNPVIREQGGFVAQSMLLIDGNITDEANVLRWDVVELVDFVVPPVADLAAEGGPEIPLTALDIRHVVFDPPQANDVVIEGVTLQLGDVIEGVPYSVAISLTGIEVPMDIADNSDAFSILQSMGFASLVMDFNIAGTFDSESDTLFAESIGINIREFGFLDISGVFSGLPLGLLQEPGGVEELLASAMVESVRIRFENNGAMDAFMRVQAELTGVLPQEVAFGLAAAFQIFLRTLENPTLEQQVGAAVGAFLRDPQTITLIAEPDEPVPLLEIVGLIVSAPTILPIVLDLVVTAND